MVLGALLILAAAALMLLFRSVAFPMNEFFPPNAVETPCDYNSTKNYCACH